MKKNYIKPEIDIVVLATDSMLLAASGFENANSEKILINPDDIATPTAKEHGGCWDVWE